MPAQTLAQTLAQLLALGQIEVGKALKFSYRSSSEPKKPKEGAVKVEVPEDEWKAIGARIASVYPIRYQKNVALRERLGHVWNSMSKMKDIKAQIEARKKAAGIRLWEDYWTGNPEDKTHWDTAEATLADCKRSLEDSDKEFVSDDKEESDPRVKHLFRFYDLENNGGENSYETEAIYLGESLDRRNGNVRHLWLTRAATVDSKTATAFAPLA